MNSHELYSTYREVKKNLFWYEVELSKEIKRTLERKNRFKFVDKKTLFYNIAKLKAFDINLLWDRNFWGLNSSDSITAIASEPYDFIRKLKETEYE